MDVVTIPERLTASRLRNGWREFFCYIAFSSAQPPVDAVSWRFVPSGRDEAILSGHYTLSEQQRKSGRAPIAAILPPEWPGGALMVNLRSGEHRKTLEWDVPTYEQPQPFWLPFHEREVLILGGHRFAEVHRSAWQIPSQQMGWDMIPLDEDGLRLLKGRQTETLRASDFAAFGQPVLAPGPGRVVQAVDGRPDLDEVGNLPQDIAYYLQDLTRASGNYVIIDHGGGVWSCLAHLRQGSIRVQERQDVATGESLGTIGNSGFSSGPHLHMHFMDGPDLLSASPLPIELEIEGETYAPQSGEIVTG